MKLSLDTALCDGEDDPLCATCLRKLAERPPLGWYMSPPMVAGQCDHYMEPRYTITEKGRAMLAGQD